MLGRNEILPADVGKVVYKNAKKLFTVGSQTILLLLILLYFVNIFSVMVFIILSIA